MTTEKFNKSKFHYRARRRIFISIPIPSEVSDILEGDISNIQSSLFGEARIVPPENWHFTIVFLGDTDEEKIPDVIKSVKSACGGFKLDDRIVEIEKISYGPSERVKRMIWFCGSLDTSRKLGVLKNAISLELKKTGISFKDEQRVFNAHITYARFRENTKNFPNLPKIEKIPFVMDKVVVMESFLSPNGAEYKQIEAITL